MKIIFAKGLPSVLEPLLSLLIAMLAWSSEARSDTSWFFKVSHLRFTREETLEMKDAVLDIKDLQPNMLMNVQGEVLLFPGEFLPVAYLNDQAWAELIASRKPLRVTLSNKVYPHLSDLKSNFGTFVFRLRAPRSMEISFLSQAFHHPLRWHFADPTGTRKVFDYGDFDRSPDLSSLTNDPARGPWMTTVEGDTTVYVFARAPELLGQSSLTLSSFLLGQDDLVMQTRYLNRFALMAITGCLFFLFLFHCIIALFRRMDPKTLYLSLYGGCAAVIGGLYCFSFGLNIAQLLQVFVVVNMLGILNLQLYLITSMQRLWPRRWLRFLNLLCPTIFGLTVFAVIAQINTLHSLCYILTVLLSSILIGGAIYTSYKHRLDGFYYFLIGTIVASILQIYLTRIAIFNLNEDNGFYVLLADFSMALALAVVNAKEYASAHHTARRLSRDLQLEVDRQTEQIRQQRDQLEAQQGELVKTHDELKSNDEQKTRFFRTISHELRTPLTLILGTLHDSDDPGRLKRSVHMASKHAKRLYRLVNQLLDFQKIALSKIKLRSERLDLVTFLESLSQSVQDACSQSNIRFEFKNLLVGQGKAIARGQLDALEKILFNYIGNAMKFTPSGGNIELSLLQRGGYLRIAVKDSGCGIALDQQDKLFKLFSQIEGPQQEGKQGTGLGLALVKELAQQMSGRVGVESREGEGACFWLDLPRLITAAESHSIVYVEPDARYRDGMQELLQKHQLEGELVRVATIAEAVAILETYPVQVLLVSASLGDEVSSLMELTSQLLPDCWRVVMFDKSVHVAQKSISTQGIQAIHSLPVDDSFFKELELHFTPYTDPTDKPLIDLVYIEDEEIVRMQFLSGLSRHSMIERFEILSDLESYKRLVQHYRVKVLICDANLNHGEQGLAGLSYSARISPETTRILLTGQATSDMLTQGLQEAQVQYVIYKPVDFAKEMPIIEDFIRKSSLQNSQEPKETDQIAQRDWQLGDFIGALPSGTDSQTQPTASEIKAHILVVDDIRDIRMLLSDMLNEAQYAVIQADSASSALRILKQGQHRIDLIICDWMMPGKTGPELLSELHESSEYSSIPFIMLTAKSDDTSRSYGLKVGSSAYLTKPFDKLEVLSVVDNLLELKRRERQLADLNDFISHNVLQRFLPPDLVKDLVAGKAVFDDAAKLQPITVLFADLCNFTRSTEQLGPTKLARILNSFLIRMTDVIFEEGGTIDKFIGDAILVFFGAPAKLEAPDQIARAHRCALRMQEALADLNEEWRAREKHQFQMRIGIHHGPAIVGSFGGQKRSDYTAIGQTVNVASRIEGQAEPGEILMSAEVRDYLDDQLWELAGSYQLKGVAGEMVLYRILPRIKGQAA